MSDNIDDRMPLWRLIMKAYDESSVPDKLLESSDGYDCLTDRYGYAAELRAIADAIPEELNSAGSVGRWLLDEADRAEAGE